MPEVSADEVKDVELPESMQRAMARQAEREKRAKIIHAEGEFQAAQTLANAAQVISSQESALQLRSPLRLDSEVLAALAEGLDVSAALRVFGHSEATITRWLRQAGSHGETLHERYLQNLHLSHVQLDEIRTRLRGRDQVLWLWLAFDPLSKLIPVLQLGPRTQDAAHSVVHQLRKRLMLGCLPVFTSDGLSLYFYAFTAHLGQWVEVV